MNPFWTSVGVWAFFSYKARKEKKKNDAIYEQALRDAQELIGTEHRSKICFYLCIDHFSSVRLHLQLAAKYRSASF